MEHGCDKSLNWAPFEKAGGCGGDNFQQPSGVSIAFVGWSLGDVEKQSLGFWLAARNKIDSLYHLFHVYQQETFNQLAYLPPLFLPANLRHMAAKITSKHSDSFSVIPLASCHILNNT